MAVTNATDPAGDSSDRRKLIVVMHADMAGYSRLIGLHDVGTLGRLRALRQDVIEPAIEEQRQDRQHPATLQRSLPYRAAPTSVRMAVRV
jgi:hypothetical protein